MPKKQMLIWMLGFNMKQVIENLCCSTLATWENCIFLNESVESYNLNYCQSKAVRLKFYACYVCFDWKPNLFLWMIMLAFIILVGNPLNFEGFFFSWVNFMKPNFFPPFEWLNECIQIRTMSLQFTLIFISFLNKFFQLIKWRIFHFEH